MFRGRNARRRRRRRSIQLWYAPTFSFFLPGKGLTLAGRFMFATTRTFFRTRKRVNAYLWGEGGEKISSPRGGETSLRLPLVENFLLEADLSYFPCDGERKFSRPPPVTVNLTTVVMMILYHEIGDRNGDPFLLFPFRVVLSHLLLLYCYYYYNYNCYYCQNGKGAIGSTRRI